jgi:hypothetical protein
VPNRESASQDGVASGRRGPTLANGVGGDFGQMTVVRLIRKGETIANLVEEVKSLTYSTGNEHAVVKLVSGQRALVAGGPGGITGLAGRVSRVYGHSHPYPATSGFIASGPSQYDKAALRHLGQHSSYLLERGRLYRYWARH